MDPRFLKEEGPDVFSGNELILKGALEAGCSFITGYPGSPISELFDAAFAQRELLKSLGIHAEMANNEALSVARLNGARMAGARAMAAMKSVGMHVAADGLALGNLAEPDNEGGCVVVVGDDPWIESTQVNNDSRYLSQHLHMPVLEPSTFQEIKDWLDSAFTLSSEANLYITYLITTPQADGGGTVWVRANQRPRVSVDAAIQLDSQHINLNKNVLLPPRSWDRELSLPSRFQTLWETARRLKLDQYLSGSNRDVGFVTAGISYTYLTHALRDLKMEGRFPILKVGLTYPLDPETILTFGKNVNTLYVVEEKRGFLESQIAEILRLARQQDASISDVAIWGKQFPTGQPGFPAERGLNVSIVKEKLRKIFDMPNNSVPLIELPVLPVRTPTFCPGCPHRDSSSVFLEIQRDFRDSAYMRKTHRQKPIDLIFHGETGCFTMLMFEPNQALMHNYSGMGLGGGTGAGADHFITNKQVVFLGDSTFFHSGLLAISDSLKSGQDILYVILDNKTTAMTGHQPTPGTDLNLMGERTYAQNIEAIVKAMGGSKVPVTRLDPGDRAAYRRLLESTVLQDGIKVVIADKECGLVVERRIQDEKKAVIREKGFLDLERFIQINPEVCEFCLICTQTTGCPGLGFLETADGPKLRTDASLCVSDGACAKIQACPAFEEVTVSRAQAAPNGRSVTPCADRESEVQGGARVSDRPFYIHIAGVGGQGAGLLSAILVQAAHADGWRALFTDKKGLAVRNGAVYGQVMLTRDGGPWAPGIPAGHADLILGLDLLETFRSVDPVGTLNVASPERASFVVNDATQPTIRMLIGRDDPARTPSLEKLKPFALPNAVWGADVARVSEEQLGDKRYANLILLGVAVQQGKIPIASKAIEQAISSCAPRASREINLRGFKLGLSLGSSTTQFIQAKSTPLALDKSIDVWTARLSRQFGASTARQYRDLVNRTRYQLDLNEAQQQDVARRIYDLMGYDGLHCAETYSKVVLYVASRDHAGSAWAATRAVIANAYKVMAIKDEFYVAYLLTREEKYERDRERFIIDPARGDRLTYRHFNQPEAVFFGHQWRKKLVTRDWQLRLVARLRFMRRWWPEWHAQEIRFRDWYLALAIKFQPISSADYHSWVQLLETPQEVRGYRELRYKQMDEVRRRSDVLCRSLEKPIHNHATA